jgi:hypothetical protein
MVVVSFVVGSNPRFSGRQKILEFQQLFKTSAFKVFATPLCGHHISEVHIRSSKVLDIQVTDADNL